MVTNAAVDSTQTLRIIFDELLDGQTVEEFFCACEGNCPNMKDASLDPTECDDDPDTGVNELGQWKDENADGVPDKARLLDGLVHISCAGVDVFDSAPLDGFYNPSGNQQVPVATGLAGLGPALVVTVSTGLRTDSDCTVTVDPSVTDKDGEPVPAPPSGTFHTEAMKLITNVPANNATGVARDAVISLTFNALLDDSTIGNVVLRVKAGGAAVPATATLKENGTTVDITPNADLAASTEFEVVVPTTVTDAFGGAFPAQVLVTFTTGT